MHDFGSPGQILYGFCISSAQSEFLCINQLSCMYSSLNEFSVFPYWKNSHSCIRG